MVVQMLFDEAGHEVVTVVLSFAHPYGQGVVRADAGLLQCARLELVAQEFIFGSLVNQDGLLLLYLRDQVGGIPIAPVIPVVSQVIRKCLLAP